MTRALPAIPVAALSFVMALTLAALAMRVGLVADDAVRLWAGASTAGTGDVPIGRIVAAYPTIPFLSTTLVAFITPVGTPAPILVAAAVFAFLAAYWFAKFCKAGLPIWAAGTAVALIAFHPLLLRAVLGGPADILLAVFLFMLGSALYDLRARSTTSEVMTVALALCALAFSHPMGAAITFATIPYLVFTVRPVLVANSALNVVLALVFPTIFGIFAFVYVSWVFPGAGWSYFAEPLESLSIWVVGVARILGDGPTGLAPLDAGLVMGAVLILGAPVAVATLFWIIRRRPLMTPLAVFTAALMTAATITVATGLFGDPTALAVAAPVLAAIVMIRVPDARGQLKVVMPLLFAGWFGGIVSLALLDPATASRLSAVLEGRLGDHELIDALAIGGAMIGKNGVLVDSQNAPAIVVGRGGARGVYDPSSESFARAILLSRLDAPFVAVPDPQSLVAVSDRLAKRFPKFHRDGGVGYRVVYQNNTWRLFERVSDTSVRKD